MTYAQVVAEVMSFSREEQLKLIETLAQSLRKDASPEHAAQSDRGVQRVIERAKRTPIADGAPKLTREELHERG